MKKFAMIVSLMTLVLAFTVTTASAQKVTGTEKATTEKVSSDKAAPAAKAACCSDKKTASAKGCCSDKAGAAKSGCSKTCTPAEKAACTKEGHANTEAAPVPKKN